MPEIPLRPCDQTADAGAYVLHALGPDEVRAYESHLVGCRTCRVEVDDLKMVVDTLPMAAPQLTPPPELKGRIMAVVEAEAELFAAAKTPPKTARRRRFAWLPALPELSFRPVTAGALAAVLLGLGVVAGGVLDGEEGPAGPAATYQAQGPGSASVRVEVGDDGHARLVMADMPAPPPGRVYQVWLADDGEAPRPTHTLFTVPSDGQARVQIDEPVGAATRVLVTDEPRGGSRNPTRQPVVVAELS